MSEWIKCSERLPEQYVDVTVATKLGCFVGYVGPYGWEVGPALGVSYDMASIIMESKATHWMSLPPAPEEE